jgi:hypothetical protein
MLVVVIVQEIWQAILDVEMCGRRQDSSLLGQMSHGHVLEAVVTSSHASDFVTFIQRAQVTNRYSFEYQEGRGVYSVELHGIAPSMLLPRHR